jgi:transcriptional regulator with XRE-family HTH domain
MKLARSQFVYKLNGMSGVDESALKEARRMRQLRRAEGFGENAAAFAKRVGWTPTQLSNYENGLRRVPRDAALQLLKVIPGFDPLWLWLGEKRALSFDLRRRLEEVEAADQSAVSSENRERDAG